MCFFSAIAGQTELKKAYPPISEFRVYKENIWLCCHLFAPPLLEKGGEPVSSELGEH